MSTFTVLAACYIGSIGVDRLRETAVRSEATKHLLAFPLLKRIFLSRFVDIKTLMDRKDTV